MASLKSTISSSPTIYSTATVTQKSRSGNTTVLNVSISTSLKSSSSYLGTGYVLKGTVTANGVSKTLTLKSSSASWSGTTAHKVSTTMSITVPAATNSITVKYRAKESGLESVSGSTASTTLSLSKQASSISSTSAGTTLSGPTINLNKVSGLTDNIVLKYGNYSIPRSNFSGGKLTFSNAERRNIFAAHGGAGVTKTWSISGTTKSGSTTIGSYSGSVNITTEAAGSITSAINHQVGDNVLTVNISHPYLKANTNDKCTVSAIVINEDGSKGVSLGSVDSTGSTAVINLTNDKIDAIYASNKLSKTGQIEYTISSYVDGAFIPGSTKTFMGTYSFVDSRCAPQITSFQLKATDKITKVIQGSDVETYVNYDSASGLISKLISGISMLKYKMTSSGQHGAEIESQQFEVVGGSILPADFNGEASSTKPVPDSVIVKATSFDSRGFSSSVQVAITSLKYASPTWALVDANRRPRSEVIEKQELKVDQNFKVNIPSYIASWEENYNNVKRIVMFYRYRELGTSIWSRLISIPFASTDLIYNGQEVTPSHLIELSGTFEANKQYELQFVVRDAVYQILGEAYNEPTIGESYSDTIIIPVSSPLISKRSMKVGINKIPTVEQGLDIDGVVDATGHVKAEEYVKAGSNLSAGTYLEFPFSNRTVNGTNNNKSQIRARRSAVGGNERAENYYEDIITFTNGRILDNNNEVLMVEVISGSLDEQIVPEDTEYEWDNLLTYLDSNVANEVVFYNLDNHLFEKDTASGLVKMSYNTPIRVTLPLSLVSSDKSSTASVEVRPIDVNSYSIYSNGQEVTKSSSYKFYIKKFKYGRYSNMKLQDFDKNHYQVIYIVLGGPELVDSNLNDATIYYDSDYVDYTTAVNDVRWAVINTLYIWNEADSLDLIEAFNNSTIRTYISNQPGNCFAGMSSLNSNNVVDIFESNTIPDIDVVTKINTPICNYFNDENACKYEIRVITNRMLIDMLNYLFDQYGFANVDTVPGDRFGDFINVVKEVTGDTTISYSTTNKSIVNTSGTVVERAYVSALIEGLDQDAEMQGTTKYYAIYNMVTSSYVSAHDMISKIWQMVYDNEYDPYRVMRIANVVVQDATMFAYGETPVLTYTVDHPDYITGTASYRIEDENGYEVNYDSNLEPGIYTIHVENLSPASLDVEIQYSTGVLTVEGLEESNENLPADLARLNTYIKEQLGWSSYEKAFKLKLISSTYYKMVEYDSTLDTESDVLSFSDLWGKLKDIFSDNTTALNDNFTTSYIEGSTPQTVASALKGKLLNLVVPVMSKTIEYSQQSPQTSYLRYNSSSYVAPTGTLINAPIKMVKSEDGIYCSVNVTDYDLLDILESTFYELDFDNCNFPDGNYTTVVTPDNTYTINYEDPNVNIDDCMLNMISMSYDISSPSTGTTYEASIVVNKSINESYVRNVGSIWVDYTFKFSNYNFDIYKYYDVNTLTLKSEYQNDHVILISSGLSVLLRFYNNEVSVVVSETNASDVQTLATYKLINNTGVYSQDVLVTCPTTDQCYTIPNDMVHRTSTPFYIDNTCEFVKRITMYIYEH